MSVDELITKLVKAREIVGGDAQVFDGEYHAIMNVLAWDSLDDEDFPADWNMPDKGVTLSELDVGDPDAV